ncbi:MAG: enterochelin esterase-like enzyme [Candidatus Pelagisphaera sp.]|jgi:enterochelin esterase-like enzyme
MRIVSFLLSALFATSSILAQAQQGTKERIKVYGHALEGNLINDPAERDVSVYLPPSYASDLNKRYPVVYMLHGFTDDDSQWFGWEEHWINLHEVIDTALADGQTKEMIVVMPNAYNRFKGSYYSSSVTIGDWETFIAKELVKYIDNNYRTISDVQSRGLAGHSMGGYGTLRLGMKYPDVYSVIYALSACCMEGAVTTDPELMNSIEAIDTLEQIENAPFRVMTNLGSAAAWAPNPNNPPFYLDLPFEDGEVRLDIAPKLSANRTLYIIDQYIPNLKKLKAIALDAGLQDRRISESTKRLHDLLETYQIPHMYESYEGNHINRIGERIRLKTLPFFSEYLSFN